MNGREKLIELIKAGGKLAVEENHKYIQEFVKNHGRYNSKTDNNFSFEELVADYLLANGVTVLPCKVGDTIYTKYKYSFKVESIEILKDKKVFRCGNDGTDDYTAFYEDEIGTEVFLTREEMEKALAKETAQNGLAYATPNFELLEG